jgi:hypothetical protein
MNDPLTILIIISTILGILLTVSELLAASDCAHNSITQWVCGSCKKEEESELQVVIY